MKPIAGQASMGYTESLKKCSQVAKEEFKIANSAIKDTEEIGAKLKVAIADVAHRRQTGGAAVEDAYARLQELEAKLETLLSQSLANMRTGLKAKRGALDRFTVTLFGRTMAGKSTIREALTRGDGSTIGKGGQRTTRDIREYTWNSLRIIDTPGIGAYEGDEDRVRALSVMDETDIVLFLVSSDGIQEESFRGMQALRQQNKPLLFVLNVKRDLEKPVYMRRFLKDARSVFEDNEVRGHTDRIQRLAGELLGMRNIRVIPIHAQAAYLATRPEYAKDADILTEQCRLGEVLIELSGDILRRGTVRRVQTVIDGTIVSLLDLQEELAELAKTVKQRAAYLKEKFDECDVWLDSFIGATNERAKSEAGVLVRPLRRSVSSFIDENIEREDISKRWELKIQALKIEAWLERQQTVILEELRGRFAEFSREMAVESEIVCEFTATNPSQYDPWDVKRSLRWTSATTAAVGSVATIAAWIGAENFWNPVGWFAGAVSVISFGLSWLFSDREKRLQKQKAKTAEQLRDSIDNLEEGVAGSLKKWFYDSVTNRLVRAIRTDTRQLYNGMFGVAKALDDASRQVGMIVDRLNKRLLVRTAEFVGAPVIEERIARVVRDPGVRTKLLWCDDTDDPDFCKQIGLAIGERVDGIPEGSLAQKVAWALRPASVSPTNVSLSGQSATARVPKSEIGRAIGRRGSNVSLASRIVGIRIKVIGEET